MRRAILAAVLLALGASASARAQSISVFSHTTIVSGQRAMSECGTTMNDLQTATYYPDVFTTCGWFQDSTPLSIWSCAPGATSRCSNIFSTIPGVTYSTNGTHGLDLYTSTQCGGYYYDPYHYGYPEGQALPEFTESGTLGARTPAACWTNSPAGLANTHGNDTVPFFVIPAQADLPPGGSIGFSAPGQVPRCRILSGPGSLDPGGCFYHAPSSVSGTQTAVIEACNIFNAADCVNATVTIRSLTVTVTPGTQEVLPEKTGMLKATVSPSTFAQTVTWKLSPTGTGSIDANGVYTAPSNDSLPGLVELTAKACSTADPTACGTAIIDVPKVLITISGTSPFLAAPGNTQTLGANVTGPATSQDVNWTVPVGTIVSIGFNTAQYTAPATPLTQSQTTQVKACMKNSPNTCGTFDLTLVPSLTIASVGTWNAGTTNSITITGNGFGTSPQVSLSDPNIQVTLGAVTNTSIALSAYVPVSSGGETLTVTVQSATGGVSPPSASANVVVTKAALQVSPASAQLRESQTQAFTSTCTAAGAPCTGLNNVTWTATAGSISSTAQASAVYTAPASVASTTTVTIKGCWSVVPEQCATAQVTVTPITVTLSPTTANVNGCSTRQFTAQVTNASPSTVTWDISPQVGAIDSNGLYTSPCPVTSQTQVQVRACSTVNSQKCGTAQVTLTPITVAVNPKTVSVSAGGSQQFTSVVQGTSNTGVTWSLSPTGAASGSIDANGLYVAPATISSVTTVTVTATSKADNATKDTAQVSLVFASAVLSPTSLTFAAQDVNTASAPQAITLSNQGTGAFSISSVTATGEFSQTNNCGSSLAAGASCTINVTFTPTGVGTRSGTVAITDTAPGSPHVVSLTGTGRGPAASLSPGSLSFGGQRAGFPTAAQTVTLANTGSGPMSISSISVTADFTQTNNCGATLAAGASCSIQVAFSPAASSLGLRTGTLQAVTNAPGSPHTASLNGTVLGGFHDYATCDGSTGWAWDSSQPNTPTTVYIFEGSSLLGSVVADKYRSDLPGAGIGNGYHAFDWAMPASMHDGVQHTITIRFSPDPNSLPIPGSPKSVTCAPAPNLQGYHDTAGCQGLAGWAWDASQPTTPITVYVFEGAQYRGSVVADQYRQDLASSGIGDGRHGFSWAIPSSLVDGQPHSLSVLLGSTSNSQALNGSPKTINCAPAPPPSASISWIQPAESSWGPAGTLTASGYVYNGTGTVELVWRERSDSGVWGPWTTDAWAPAPGSDGGWSNTISSGSPTNTCHWFEAYVNYSGVSSAVYQYTGTSGCP
jgi:hypothetical protein